jgi:hypothetical protein
MPWPSVAEISRAQHSSRLARIPRPIKRQPGAPRQIDITGQANRHNAPVAINCPLTGVFECQLEKKELKMAVNAHLVIQTILPLAMAGTVAYCWINVLFPAARLD